MINEITNKKSVVSLAVRAALIGALTMGLAACGDDGDTSTSTSTSDSQSQTDATQPIVENQSELSGSVSGQVVDTNGNPIAGATVFMAGQESVTTDAGGQYFFANVTVTNVNGVNNEGGENDDDIGNALSITIVAPSGYLGGTVTVTPEAQVNNTGGQGNGQNGGNSDVPVSTFVDGFQVEAGTAILPAVTARVGGYLVSCIDTDQDTVLEDPAVGVPVVADMTGVGGTITTIGAGATFDLAVPSFDAISDDTGYFEFLLPADSAFNFLVSGLWAYDSDDNGSYETQSLGAINTNDEVGLVVLGHNGGVPGTAHPVCAITGPGGEGSAPNTPPEYDTIDGASGVVLTDSVTIQNVPAATSTTTNVGFLALQEGVNNDFVIRFTEALPNITLDDIRVRVNTGLGDVYISPESYSVVVSEDFTSMTLSFPEDLGQGVKVEVFLLQTDKTDVDGAAFVDNGSSWDEVNVTFGGDGSWPTYNGAGALPAGEKSAFTAVRFCTFQKEDPLDPNANIALGAQVIDFDVTEDAGETTLADYSSVFADNIDGIVDIGAEDTDLTQVNGDTFTAQRLVDLGDAVVAAATGVASAPLAGGGVDFDVAHVPYSERDGVVTFDLERAGASVGNVIDNVVNATSGTLVLQGALDGDVVTAVAENDYGDVVVAQSLTLVDAIAPTTVLQENYGITRAGTPAVTGAPKEGLSLVGTAATAGVSFGDGGEATDGTAAVSGVAGNPLIYVQPRHLVARNAALSADVRGDEFNALTVDMAARLGTGETSTGLASADLSEFNTRPLYDRTAFTNWGSVAQNVGVAVSEDFTLTGAAPATTGISTALSNFVAQNDVTVNVDDIALAGVTEADLLRVTVADVLNLANVDHGGVISLSGVIQDTAGTPNVTDADSNAQVILQDAFPPMVTSARWTGTSVIITFNEDISVPTATAAAPYLATSVTMELIDPLNVASIQQITLDATETVTTNNGYFTYDSVTNTLTVTNNALTVWQGDTTANDATQDEFFYNDDVLGDTDEEKHAVLNWDRIYDANGNRWMDYTNVTAAVPAAGAVKAGEAAANLANDTRWEVNAPQFLAVDELGTLDVDLDLIIATYDNAANPDDEITIVLESNFAIDLDATFNQGNAALGGLTNANVTGAGLVLSGAVVDAILDTTGVVAGGTIDQPNTTGLVSADRLSITFNVEFVATEGVDTGDVIAVDNTALDAASTATDDLARTDTIQSINFN